MKNSLKGFLISDSVIVMGLIAVLAVAMISINKFNKNSYIISQARLSQTDAIIKKWGNAVTKSNETDASVTKKFTNVKTIATSIASSTMLKTKPVYEDFNKAKLTLANEVDLSIEYTLNKNIQQIPNVILIETLSPIAVITAHASAGTEEETYVLLPDKVGSVDELYSDYEKKKLTLIDLTPNDQKYEKTPMVCLDNNLCGDDKFDKKNPEKKGCEAFPQHCQQIPSCGDNVYVYLKKGTKTTKCGENQNGQISISNIANACGTYQLSVNSCCNNPLTYSGNKNGVPICSCNVEKIRLSAGEVFIEGNNAPCKKLVDIGQYSDNNHKAMLCGTGKNHNNNKGYYCDTEGLASSKICPKGYYCPDSIEKLVKDKNGKIYFNGQLLDTSNEINLEKIFHKTKFYNNNEKITEKANYNKGGLKEKIKCPEGYYCPNDGMLEAKICPEGYYCPEGSIDKIPCPAGTYNSKQGQSNIKHCLNCSNIGQYQNQKGQKSCKPCENGIINNNGTACITCKAGEEAEEQTQKCIPCKAGYYNSKPNGKCVECPPGTVSTTSGATTCTPCNCNKYQNKNDHTKCVTLKDGEYTIDTNIIEDDGTFAHFEYTDSAIGITDKNVEICPKGYKCPPNKNVCGNGRIKCQAGYYQDKEGQTECKKCDKGYYQDNEAQERCKKCNNGKYQDEKGQTSCKTCKTGTYSPDADEAISVCTPCDAGYFQKETGKTFCEKCPINTYSNKKGQNECTKCQSYKHTLTVGSTSENACICNENKPDNFVLPNDKVWDSTTLSCTRNLKVYIIASYPVSPPIWWNKNSTLTVEDMIKDFSLVADCASYTCKDSGMPDRSYRDASRYWGFSGSWYHNINHSNDKEWTILLNKISDEDKKKTFFGAEAYIFLENGKLLTTVNSSQIAPIYWGKTGTYPNNPDFKLISGTGIEDTARNVKEESSGGKISYKGQIYDVTYTIYRQQTPFVLDIKGDGLKFTNLSDGVKFDLDGNGIKEQTSWTTLQRDFDDAFLIYDKNENGVVDNGLELFGAQNGAENGFGEIAKYDDNGDGIIDKNDKEFYKLKVWCDMNKNGLTDTYELKTLQGLNISEISTIVTSHYNKNDKLLKDKYNNTTGFTGEIKIFIKKIINGVEKTIRKFLKMIDSLFITK